MGVRLAISRDLHEHTGALIHDAGEGKLSLVTKSNEIASLTPLFIFRFRKEIKTNKLYKVIGFSPEEFEEFNRLYMICCDITEAHDQAQAQRATLSTPDDLKKDIAAAKKLLEIVHTRQKLLDNQHQQQKKNNHEMRLQQLKQSNDIASKVRKTVA